jgi:hypothetical protein
MVEDSGQDKYLCQCLQLVEAGDMGTSAIGLNV